MHFRKSIGPYQLYIAITHSHIVKGVNSNLEHGQHFLMWDFDGVSRDDVFEALEKVQQTFMLPPVYVVNTGLVDHFHAYCFARVGWPRLLQILASTDHLDPMYFKIGVMRGYLTLRISPKRKRDMLMVKKLVGIQDADQFDPLTIASFCRYWTKRF